MIRITLMDGSQIEIPREDALEIIPYRHVFSHQMLKSPVEGLLAHHGKLVPVLGPMPKSFDKTTSVDNRPWLLLMKGCAQVIRGLPTFQEAAVVSMQQDLDQSLIDEVDELLKSA